MADTRYIGLEGQWINDAKQKIKFVINQAKDVASSVLDGVDRSDTADVDVEVRMAQARAGGYIDSEFMGYLDSYVADYRRTLEDAHRHLTRMKNRPPESKHVDYATGRSKNSITQEEWWPAHYKKKIEDWKAQIDHSENVIIPDLNNAISYANDQKQKVREAFRKEISKNIQSIPNLINPDYDKVQAARDRTQRDELDMMAQDLADSYRLQKVEGEMPPKVSPGALMEINMLLEKAGLPKASSMADFMKTVKEKQSVIPGSPGSGDAQFYIALADQFGGGAPQADPINFVNDLEGSVGGIYKDVAPYDFGSQLEGVPQYEGNTGFRPSVTHTSPGMWDDEEDWNLSHSDTIKKERLDRGVQAGDFLPEAPQGVSQENLPTYTHYWDQFYQTGGGFDTGDYQNPPPPNTGGDTGDMGMGDGRTDVHTPKGFFTDSPGAPDTKGEYSDPPPFPGKDGDVIEIDGVMWQWRNGVWNRVGGDSTKENETDMGDLTQGKLSPIGDIPDWWPFPVALDEKGNPAEQWFPTKPISTRRGYELIFDWDTFLEIAQDFDPQWEQTRGGYFQTREREIKDAATQHQYDLDRIAYTKELDAQYRALEADEPVTYRRENVEITGMPGVTVPAIVGSDGSIDTIDIPTLEQQIDRAILDGDMNLARAYTGIRNMPSAEKKLELMMQVSQSPADVFQLSNMAAGRGLDRFGELAPAMRQAAMGILSDPFEQAMAARNLEIQQMQEPGTPAVDTPQVGGESTPKQDIELQPGIVYMQDASGNIVPKSDPTQSDLTQQDSPLSMSPLNMNTGSGSYNTGSPLSGGGAQENWRDPSYNPRAFFQDILPTDTYGLQLMNRNIHIDPSTGQPRHNPLTPFENLELGFDAPQSRDQFIQAYDALLKTGVSPIDAARSLGMDEDKLAAFVQPETQQISGPPGNPFATGFEQGLGGMGDNSMIFPSGMANLMSGEAPTSNPSSSLLGSSGLPIPSMQQWGAFLPEERDVFNRYAQTHGIPEHHVGREIQAHTPGPSKSNTARRIAGLDFRNRSRT